METHKNIDIRIDETENGWLLSVVAYDWKNPKDRMWVFSTIEEVAEFMRELLESDPLLTNQEEK